ncbi:MAG: ATP-dependent 6-phosphofructokinase [Lentisphaerae bacterium]|nr:ATP-dependent 6-phosphofructokinase [Lentisphaerota bacterium]
MENSFQVLTLGECIYDSPVTSSFNIDKSSSVLVNTTLQGCADCNGDPVWFEQAGPRKKLFFAPREGRAAIVTCGGLCPGLNSVIRGLTMVLWYRYGYRSILGIRYGYNGLTRAARQPPVNLTPDIVEDIHKDGGTILGSSRGPQKSAEIVDFLVSNRINILFTVGGDGTQRGALSISNEIKERGLNIAVVGIPKTIDNDISYTERTFGFETAVAMSQAPIVSAHMEAKGAFNGIGLVKLMGRESGFVAAYASLASGDVNIVLVPEIPFETENLMSYLTKRLKRKSHAVIVVAEGAGQHLVPTDGVDASGNRKLGDIGLFLKKSIIEYMNNINMKVSVKYIDPSYTIRSAPASADDSVFCFQLAANAVHAAMAGRTAMVVALWNGKFVHVPMEKAVEKRKKIDPCGLLWQCVQDYTGQPSLA